MNDARRLYLAVGLAAVVVYLGALGNRFALDDLVIIARDPLIHSLSGVWRAFTQPYQRGAMYRPLVVASYALDWPLHSYLWYHAVNLVWNAAAAVLVAVLAKRWIGAAGALAAGLLFALHPVHVEAVANVVGRDELMAAVFALLAVYAALVRGSVVWSAVSLALGLLCKENAAVVPGLVVLGWALGLAPSRPSRRDVGAFVLSWVLVAVAYGAARWTFLHTRQDPFLAPVFLGQSPLAVRLTAIAALTDVSRLLVVPLTLRADYGPLERTAVVTPADPRLLLGLACLAVWGVLFVLAWRRGRRVEALGLGWIAIAFSPVANLLFPTGILVAERTLYLPSVGLALAAGALFERWHGRPRWLALGGVVLLLGMRTVTRVPVWRSDMSAVLSILEDSPRSYVGPKRMVAVYLDARQPDKAVDAARQAIARFPWDRSTYVTGAAAAFAAGLPGTADSLLEGFQRLCPRCGADLQHDAALSRQRGYRAAADSLAAWARNLDAP